MVKGCDLLEALILNNCTGISDASVAAVAKYSVDVRRLSLKGCTALTDTALKVLLLTASTMHW